MIWKCSKITKNIFSCILLVSWKCSKITKNIFSCILLVVKLFPWKTCLHDCRVVQLGYRNGERNMQFFFRMSTLTNVWAKPTIMKNTFQKKITTTKITLFCSKEDVFSDFEHFRIFISLISTRKYMRKFEKIEKNKRRLFPYVYFSVWNWLIFTFKIIWTMSFSFNRKCIYTCIMYGWCIGPITCSWFDRSYSI